MRLALWTGGLLAGVVISLGIEATPRAAAWAGVPALAVVLALLRGRYAAAAEVVAALAVGGYAGARAQQPPPLPAAVGALLDHDGQPPPAEIEGWVVSAPEPASEGRQGSRLRIRAVAIDGVALPPDRGLTLGLSVAAGVPPLLPGDNVRFAARLRSVRGLANPGVSDGTLTARAAGVELFAGVGAASGITTHPPASRAPPGLQVLRAAARARQALAAAIDRVVPGAAGVLLHTAVLGERRATAPLVEAGFRAAGATHVLSVSGLHLAAITLVCFAGARWGLARVPRLPLWLDIPATAAAIAVPVVVFYTLITGAAVATVRSAVMMVVALVGTVVGRRSVAVSAIAAAVVALLAWSPLVVADISFQLSVVSVLALTTLAARLGPAAVAHSDGAPAAWWRRALRWSGRWLARMAAASLAAGLTTAPLVAHAFGEVAPAGPLGNLLLVPLIELVVVPFGLAGALLGALGGRDTSVPFLTLASWAAQAALAIAEGFRVHAPVWLTRSPGAFETAGLSLGLAGAMWSIRRSGDRRFVLPAALVVLGAAVASMAASEVLRRSSRDVVITFLDVGQGDAAVIEAPGGRTLLIDAGGTYDGSFDPGARVVEPFLRARGIVRVDLLALSHPHPDHQGGMHRILQRFPVGVLWTSGDDGRNPDYHLLLREARAANVPTPVPAQWYAGGLTLEPLGPYALSADGANERIGPSAGVSVNDASLVLRAAFGPRSVLFTGDIEADGEGELCGRASVGQVVTADVLKVPHHGSRTSSSDELLEAVRPRLAVMSLGWRNRFRFPRPEIVQRYRARGIRLLRTDLHGAVTLTLGPDGAMSTQCARGCDDGSTGGGGANGDGPR